MEGSATFVMAVVVTALIATWGADRRIAFDPLVRVVCIHAVDKPLEQADHIFRGDGVLEIAGVDELVPELG